MDASYKYSRKVLAADGQDPKQAKFFRFKKREHLKDEQIDGAERTFSIIKFDESDSLICVDKGLSVDFTDTFRITDLEIK